MKGNVLLTVLLAGVSGALAQPTRLEPVIVAAPPTVARRTVKMPNPNEKLVPGRAVWVKHPVGLQMVRPKEEREDFLRLRWENFILPQIYPAKEFDPALRLHAYEQLRAMRKELRVRHLTAGWINPRRPRPNAPHGGETPGTTDPGGCAWFAAGPTNINGRVTHLVIDPTDRNRIFATSVGGIWRSTDAGRRWQRVSDDFLATVFASVAINPGDPSEVLAGGGDPNYGSAWSSGLGIWRSTSGGDAASWSKVSPPALDNQVIYRIRFDPVAPHDVYVATGAGVYLGTHSGASITFARIGGFDAWTNDLVVDFSTTPRKVYAGVSQASTTYARGIWKWDGATWQKRDTGIPSTSIGTLALALATSSPATIFAKVAQSDGQLQGIYKTTTAAETPGGGGNAWTILPSASVLNDSGWPGFYYSWYNSVIEVDPANANIAYAGGLNIYRTTDGGTTWNQVSGGADASYPYWVHADQHAVTFDPVNPKIVYTGDDGGINKSTDTSAATWHWSDVSHGMQMTEFYRMTSQQTTATLVAGGSQDNGTEITFGNRTWYNPGGCDGADVAVDGQNPDTLYANCNGGLYELANPVPGTAGGGSQITWSSPTAPVHPPVATDQALVGRAIAAGGDTCNPQYLLKTSDGVNWAPAGSALPNGARVTAVAIAPSSSFATYYVGVVYSPPSATDCPGYTSTAFTPTIYRTTDGGTTWASATTGLPGSWPTSIAVDATDANRAFVTYGGTSGLFITSDGGATWSSLKGSGAGALPDATVWGVTISPFDANLLYAATSVGVFRGTVSGTTPPTASWVPFDEGLPDGLNVTGVWVNRSNGILTIGSMGHGAFQRDVRPGAACTPRMLLVRDNVFDRAVEPSPYGVPDAEHPIPDPARPGFYKPDDSPGGLAYWWTSGDLRIDVPVVDPAKNLLSTVDHVEFETCPSLIADCPAGTMVDSYARRGHPARAYVQVANRGFQPVTQVRVIALWADATTTVPMLPPNFWTTTFPAGTTTCGALDTSTGWHLMDAASPCKLIPVVNPDVPEVARFNWAVSASAPTHTCMLVVTEAADDPIDPSVRASNELRPWVLVPNRRHISQRNLHVVDPTTPGGAPMMMEEVAVLNPTKEGGIDLIFSQIDLKERVRFLLPRGVQPKLRGVRAGEVKLTAEQERRAIALKLDPRVVYEVVSPEAIVGLPIPSGKTWKVALIATYDGPPNTSARVAVVAKQGATILGGSTYVLRRVPKSAFVAIRRVR